MHGYPDEDLTDRLLERIDAPLHAAGATKIEPPVLPVALPLAKKYWKGWWLLASTAGLEPATCGLEIRCSSG